MDWVGGGREVEESVGRNGVWCVGGVVSPAACDGCASAQRRAGVHFECDPELSTVTRACDVDHGRSNIRQVYEA